jgi:hypothetical protein
VGQVIGGRVGMGWVEDTYYYSFTGVVTKHHRDINELLNPNVFKNRPENLCNDLCHKSCCFGGLFLNVIGSNVSCNSV